MLDRSAYPDVGIAVKPCQLLDSALYALLKIEVSHIEEPEGLDCFESLTVVA
jgi:hypothetical protein